MDAGSPLGATCPRCGAATEFADDAFTTGGAPPPDTSPRLRLEVLLDNVRSLSNVGSIFRTADGAGVAHLHLGGITPTPAHPKLAKTSLGAELRVPWTSYPDPCVAAEALLARGCRLWALEGGAASTSLFAPEALAARPQTGTLVLVLGHEVSGIDPRLLRVCERILHLPMEGIKDSLNVSVAFGIAVYTLRYAAAV